MIIRFLITSVFIVSSFSAFTQVNWDNKGNGNYRDVVKIVDQFSNEFIYDCPLNNWNSPGYTINDWTTTEFGNCLNYIIDVKIYWYESGGLFNSTKKGADGILCYICENNKAGIYLYRKDFFHEVIRGGCLGTTDQSTVEKFSELFGKDLTKWNYLGYPIKW